MKVASLFEIDIKYIEEDIKKKFIEKYQKSKRINFEPIF